jgi:hypothetical protein
LVDCMEADGLRAAGSGDPPAAPEPATALQGGSRPLARAATGGELGAAFGEDHTTPHTHHSTAFAIQILSSSETSTSPASSLLTFECRGVMAHRQLLENDISRYHRAYEVSSMIHEHRGTEGSRTPIDPRPVNNLEDPITLPKVPNIPAPEISPPCFAFSRTVVVSLFDWASCPVFVTSRA